MDDWHANFQFWRVVLTIPILAVGRLHLYGMVHLKETDFINQEDDTYGRAVMHTRSNGPEYLFARKLDNENNTSAILHFMQ